VTWQSVQRARRVVTVTVSVPMPRTGAGPAAAELPQRTPDTVGRAGCPPAGSLRPLRGATPPSRYGSPFMPASITYHGRRQQRHFVLRDANSHCAPSRRCRPNGRSAHAWCSPTPRDRSTWEIPLIVVVMTPTNHPGADWSPASPVTATPAVNGISSGFQHPAACRAASLSVRFLRSHPGWPGVRLELVDELISPVHRIFATGGRRAPSRSRPPTQPPRSTRSARR
jgi:hypothetical protein